MRNFLFFLFVGLSVSLFGQTSYYEKYNDLTGRYEYYDSNTNTLVAYKKYNSLQQRWETVYVKEGQNSGTQYSKTKSVVNTELLNQVMSARQQRYDNNVQRVKTVIDNNYQNIDITFRSDLKFANLVKERYYKKYVQALEGQNIDYSNDFSTNSTINYLNSSLKNLYDELEKMMLEVKNSPQSNKSSRSQTVTPFKETIPRMQKVTSYAPIYKEPDTVNSAKIGSAVDNKVEVLEKYNDKIYKVKSGGVTGYMAKSWFND